MVIVIGADGGPLGGPVRFLDKATEAFDKLGDRYEKKRDDDRRDRLEKEATRRYDTSRADELAREETRKTERAVDDARADRQEERMKASSEVQDAWIKKRTEMEDLERADRINDNKAAWRLMRGYDPSDEQLGIDDETAKKYGYDPKSEVYPSLQVEIRRQMENPGASSNPQALKVAAEQAVRARKVSGLRRLIQRVGMPDQQAGGGEGAGTELRREQTLPAEQAKRLMKALEVESKRPGSVDLDQIEGELGSYVRQANRARTDNDMINWAGQQMQGWIAAASASGVDLETLTEAQNLADDATSVGLTGRALESAMEDVREVLRGGAPYGSPRTSSRSRISSTRGRGSDRPAWMTDEDEQYDRDVKNAKDLGLSGQDALQYINESQQRRAGRGGAPAAQPAGAAPGAAGPAQGQPPAQSQDPRVALKSQDPKVRVSAVKPLVDMLTQSGVQVPAEVEFAAMKAARDGEDVEAAMRKAMKRLKAKAAAQEPTGNPKYQRRESAYPRKLPTPTKKALTPAEVDDLIQ